MEYRRAPHLQPPLAQRRKRGQALSSSPRATPLDPRPRSWIAWISQPRPKVRTALRWTLIASLALHSAFSPALPGMLKQGGDKGQVREQATEYEKKIEAAKSARVISQELAKKNSMPPPPMDPEAVVSKTLTQEIDSDVHKVVGALLDAQVKDKLSQKVAAGLKDQLDAAAKEIAAGKLSSAEIRALQEKFKSEAHTATVAALKEHRIETQVERASVSTTEWYQETVSRVLFARLYDFLFGGPHQWYWVYSPPEFQGPTVWNDLTTANALAKKIQTLNETLSGQTGWKNDPTIKYGRLPVLHPSWPGPNKDQATYLLAQLHSVFDVLKYRSFGTELIRSPSWEDGLYGGPNSCGLLNEFYPHQEAEIRSQYSQKLSGLWKSALGEAEQYLRQAEAEAPDEELKTAQQASFKAIQTLVQTANELMPKPDKQAAWPRLCGTVNQYLRTEVLHSSYRDKMYQLWVDRTTDGLAEVIREYAETQFEKGIIKKDKSLEKMKQEFSLEVVPLLRRDVKTLIPERTFQDLIFVPYKHVSKMTGNRGPPSEEDLKNESEALAKLLSENPDLAPYAEKRREKMKKHFENAIVAITEHVKTEVYAKGLLFKSAGAFMLGVDTADPVEEKLSAREAAIKGRGQDLANLTPDGVPDTSAARFALQLGGGKGAGASLEPFMTIREPGFLTRSRPQQAVRGANPKPAPPAAKWGFETQASREKLKPSFTSPNFEGIPFLQNFPGLDGDLSDWGKVRPLILKPKNVKGNPADVLLYAGWNYQGFCFGYEVKEAKANFFYPVRSKTNMRAAGTSITMSIQKVEGMDWPTSGDHFRAVFDTLDARNQNRGEPHTQEFVIVPLGTDANPLTPGIERIFASQRAAKHKDLSGKVFLDQPTPEQGPDGTGPYRITKATEEGYTTEIFFPRSIFNVPYFAPGWLVGFDCAVALGGGGHSLFAWTSNDICDYRPGAGNPSQWGDLLLLGTDPRVTIQDGDAEGSASQAIVPGHSYLLTVVDPDRNVNLLEEDTVVISAEVAKGDAKQGGKVGDVEVFVLKETGKNTGVFRGYIDTQPGFGRELQGVLEVMPGQEVVFGYVDFANALGQRSKITELRLPVVSGVLLAQKKKGE